MGNPTRIIATLCTLGVLAVIASWTLRQRRRRRCAPPDPKQWQLVGHLAELAIYPLKSGGADLLGEVACDAFGLQSMQGLRDRQLIVYSDDEQQSLAWAGIYPRMLSIETKLTTDGRRLKLTAPDMPPLEVDWQALLQQTSDAAKVVKKLRGFKQPLIKCAEPAHAWISQFLLQKPNGLCLYVAETPVRDISWWRTIACDYMPIMAMHDKSMADLNERLGTKNAAHYRQFRGNFLIASTAKVPPYDEDNWQWLKIGDEVILRYAEPCRRCILPNVNIETCERNADFEPLKTLKQYRMKTHPKSPDMGVYFEVFKSGNIRKGCPVYVQYK